MEKQHQNHISDGAAKSYHGSLTYCVNHKIFRSEPSTQRTVPNMECFLHCLLICFLQLSNNTESSSVSTISGDTKTGKAVKTRRAQHPEAILSCTNPKNTSAQTMLFPISHHMCSILNKLSLSKYLIYRNKLLTIIIRCEFLML